jgi:hypothetical protein
VKKRADRHELLPWIEIEPPYAKAPSSRKRALPVDPTLDLERAEPDEKPLPEVLSGPCRRASQASQRDRGS